MYLDEGKFVVEMKDGKVEVDRTNNNKVQIPIYRWMTMRIKERIDIFCSSNDK